MSKKDRMKCMMDSMDEKESKKEKKMEDMDSEKKEYKGKMSKKKAMLYRSINQQQLN